MLDFDYESVSDVILGSFVCGSEVIGFGDPVNQEQKMLLSNGKIVDFHVIRQYNNDIEEIEKRTSDAVEKFARAKAAEAFHDAQINLHTLYLAVDAEGGFRFGEYDGLQVPVIVGVGMGLAYLTIKEAKMIESAFALNSGLDTVIAAIKKERGES